MSVKTAIDVEVFKLVAQGVPRNIAAARVQAEQSKDRTPPPFGNIAKRRRWTP